MKTVYIFRGAPAVGKGEIAPRFAKLLPIPVALIEQDAFRWGFHLIGREVSEVTDAEHKFAQQNMLLIYEQYLKNGSYDIVIEGLFTWDDNSSSQGRAKHLIELAEQNNFDVKCVVLRADKDELRRRNEERKYSVPDDEFNYLYDKVYAESGPDEIVIDSTKQNVEETLQELRSKLLFTKESS